MTKILSEQEQVRRTSLDELWKLDSEPFPAAEFNVSHKSADTLSSLTEGYDREFAEVSLAGRLKTKPTIKPNTRLLAMVEGQIKGYEIIVKGLHQ